MPVPAELRIRRVAVVGTGVIGASWVAAFLAAGLDVVATDPAPGAEARLTEAVERHWPVLTELGLASGASCKRLRFTADLAEALADADFVQENGPEREDFKIDFFARMDALAPPRAILASSSSGLLVSRMQSACARPGRVLLGHPFNPPHLIPLVEVIGGERTDAASIDRAMAFYAAIGKRPIRIRKEVKGHVANRLQAALWREAFHLAAEGVASVEDIDTAIAHGPGLRWALLGPFMALDLSGGEGGMAHLLDHLGGPIEQWWLDLGAPRMTPEVKAAVIAGTAAARHAPRADIEAARDRLLIGLLQAKARLGEPNAPAGGTGTGAATAAPAGLASPCTPA
ncbi:3-hydroxyacyl-CoA dehydrogenase NAD-binding domain-containing protein [Derxia gummosa]|uniref:3-hydroxyacyl-CoA dehydrogenase NAD-binding domain-containing protein n=1 Tax=Derxia gummosa DSM 723 TaxID=1121388 RepID=A0A8B6XBN0_9BURK|nr:3-hydroxyacyl-CoA dehydrogenase NAD-binding domain-containing protein [Derxia gummosa]